MGLVLQGNVRRAAKGEESSRDLNAKKSSLWFIAKLNFPALSGLEHSCQPQGWPWEHNPSAAGKGQHGTLQHHPHLLLPAQAWRFAMAPTNRPFALAAARRGCSRHCPLLPGTVGDATQLLSPGCEGLLYAQAVIRRAGF